MRRQKQPHDEILIKAMRRAGQRSRAPRGLAQATLSRMGLGKSSPRLATRLAWSGALAATLLALIFAVKQVPRPDTSLPSLAHAPEIRIAPKHRSQASHSAPPRAIAQTKPSVNALAPVAQQESQTTHDSMVKARSSAPVLAKNDNSRAPQSVTLNPSSPSGERPWGSSSQALSGPSASAAGRDEKTRAPATFAITLKNSYFKPGLGQELKVELQLVQAGLAKLRILDSNGIEVRSLNADLGTSTAFTFIWNGRDSHGADAASGAYTLIIESPGRVDKRACVLVR